jgi:hypothetical protein
LAVSRPLLEFTVRSRVALLPGVRFIDRHDVAGLTASACRSRITGVRIRDRDNSTAAEVVLDADLVVGAAGRSPHSLAWLAELGYARVPEVKPSSVSSTCPGSTGVSRTILTAGWVLPSPRIPGSCAVAFVLAQEGGRLILSISGWAGDEPPTDDEGSAEFASALAAPDIAEIVRTAPSGTVVATTVPAAVRLHWQRRSINETSTSRCDAQSRQEQ